MDWWGIVQTILAFLGVAFVLVGGFVSAAWLGYRQEEADARVEADIAKMAEKIRAAKAEPKKKGPLLSSAESLTERYVREYQSDPMRDWVRRWEECRPPRPVSHDRPRPQCKCKWDDGERVEVRTFNGDMYLALQTGGYKLLKMNPRCPVLVAEARWNIEWAVPE